MSAVTLDGPILFHPYHGENVLLYEGRHRALRRVSFEKALVFSERSLRIREPFFVSIENVEGGWTGHMRIGLTRIDPNNQPEPSAITGQSWLVSVSPFSLDSPSTSLPTEVGSRVGVYYAPCSRNPNMAKLHLVLNGFDLSPDHVGDIPLDEDLYAVVDVFGNTKEVRIAPLLRSPDRLTSLCTRRVRCLLSDGQCTLHTLPPNLQTQLFPAG